MTVCAAKVCVPLFISASIAGVWACIIPSGLMPSIEKRRTDLMSVKIYAPYYGIGCEAMSRLIVL
mgnify:CR=1 FL=1